MSPAGYAGREWLAKVKRDLLLSGFQAEVTWNDRKMFNTSWIRVTGLLQEAGVSSHSDQKLSVKIEKLGASNTESTVEKSDELRRKVLNRAFEIRQEWESTPETEQESKPLCDDHSTIHFRSFVNI